MSEFTIKTRIFDYMSVDDLSGKTGLTIEYLAGIKNGGEITSEFIEAVLNCFPSKLFFELFYYAGIEYENITGI